MMPWRPTRAPLFMKLSGESRLREVETAQNYSRLKFTVISKRIKIDFGLHQPYFLYCLPTRTWYRYTPNFAISSSAEATSDPSQHQRQENPTFACPSEAPDNLSWSWWDTYIQGINPDYPPRQRMYAFLTSQSICVRDMEIREVEEFTKYLEMRRVYGKKFPLFPYDINFDDKLEDLKRKYPLFTRQGERKKK